MVYSRVNPSHLRSTLDEDDRANRRHELGIVG